MSPAAQAADALLDAVLCGGPSPWDDLERRREVIYEFRSLAGEASCFVDLSDEEAARHVAGIAAEVGY